MTVIHKTAISLAISENLNKAIEDLITNTPDAPIQLWVTVENFIPGVITHNYISDNFYSLNSFCSIEGQDVNSKLCRFILR